MSSRFHHLAHIAQADISEFRATVQAQLERLAVSKEDVLPDRIKQHARPHTHRTVFPSVKANESFWCESKLESDFCLSMEADPIVIYYLAQPLILRDKSFVPSGRYTPDFVTLDENHSLTFIEVKLSSSRLTPKDWSRFTTVQQFLARRQLNFRVVYADEIRKQPLYSFLHEAHSRTKQARPEALNEFASWIYRRGGAVTLTEIRKAFPTYGIGYAALLLYRRMLLPNQSANGDLCFTAN